MLSDYPQKFNPAKSWLRVHEPLAMPLGRYRGKPIDEIQDYGELRKFASYPFADLLDDQQLRAIERRLLMVHPDAGEGGDDVPFEFVERCREASRRAKNEEGAN